MQSLIVFAATLAVAFAGNYEKAEVTVKQETPAAYEYKTGEVAAPNMYARTGDVSAQNMYAAAAVPTFYNAAAFPGYAYAVKSYEPAPVVAPAPAVATVYKAEAPVAPVVTFKKFEAAAPAPAAVAVKAAFPAPAFAAAPYAYGFKPAFYNYAHAAPAFYGGAYKYAAPYAYAAAAPASYYSASFAAPAVPGYGFNYGYGYSY